MNTYKFVKDKNGWHVMLPGHTKKGGNKADLDMVEGADTMLNLYSGGRDEVTISLNKEPFENADELELVGLCEPMLEGGYYRMKKFGNKEVNYEMWVCDVNKFVFGDHPEKIYIRKDG